MVFLSVLKDDWRENSLLPQRLRKIQPSWQSYEPQPRLSLCLRPSFLSQIVRNKKYRYSNKKNGFQALVDICASLSSEQTQILEGLSRVKENKSCYTNVISELVPSSRNSSFSLRCVSPPCPPPSLPLFCCFICFSCFSPPPLPGTSFLFITSRPRFCLDVFSPPLCLIGSNFLPLSSDYCYLAPPLPPLPSLFVPSLTLFFCVCVRVCRYLCLLKSGKMGAPLT